MTYGQSYTGYNQAAAGKALDADSDDDEDDKKGKKPAAAPAVAVAPVAVPYPPQYPPGVGYMPSPVHPMGYVPSPVPYGMSPVAMYPAAPWNAMPVSPVPMQVPEYIKKQVRIWDSEEACCGDRLKAPPRGCRWWWGGSCWPVTVLWGSGWWV